jgi:glutaredoxin
MASKPGKVIKFYGAMWCADCRRAKTFFDEHEIKYEYHDTETEKGALDIVERFNKGMQSIPTIIFPDGSILVEPSNQELAEKTGLSL